MEKNGLPKGWAETELGELCGSIEKTNLKFEDANKEFYYLDINSIDNIAFKITEPKTYLWKDAPSRAQQKVKANDILFSTVRPYLKNIAIVPEKYDDQIASTGFCVIRPDGVNPKYVYYYVLTSSFINSLNELARGTSYPAVRNSDVFGQNIPLPPLPEQHRIVTKIEELFSELDHGVAQMQALLAQLKTYRQSVLKYAFEGKLTEGWRKENVTEPAAQLLEQIKAERQSRFETELAEWKAAKARGEKLRKPSALKEFPPLTEEEVEGLPDLPEGWMWVRTGNVIDPINNGYTPTSEYLFRDSGEVPFIKVYNLNFDGSFNFKKDPTFIPEEIHKTKLTRSITYPGDVLINIVGPPLGKTSIVPNLYPEWNINQAIVMFRPDEFVTSKFISYFMQNPQTIHWLEATSKATAGQYNVKVSTCREIPFPFCSIEEQHQIVSAIESRLSIADQAEAVLRQELAQAEALRQSILKRAFEGRLVGQEAGEEPAGVLLERIRAEREKIGKEKT